MVPAIFLLLFGLVVLVLGYRMKKVGKKVRGTILMIVAAVPLFFGVLGLALILTIESTTETTQTTIAPAPTSKPKETLKETPKETLKETSKASPSPKPTPTHTAEPTLEELALDELKDLPEYTVKAFKEGDKMPSANGNMNCTSKKCYQVVFDVKVGTPEEKTLSKNLDTIQPLGMDVVSTYFVMYWAKDYKKMLDATFR